MLFMLFMLFMVMTRLLMVGLVLKFRAFSIQNKFTLGGISSVVDK